MNAHKGHTITEAEKSFCSKILLFGEYSIIKHSRALAMPYNLFQGHLTFSYENRKEIKGPDQELRAFVLHLKNLLGNEDLPYELDVTSFDFDIGQGLHFESTIPQGFGVGSSGALCAAIFDRYARYKLEEDFLDRDIPHLKSFFSKMESHFHGASSGIDPLISFINRPLLLRSKNEYEQVRLPQSQNNGAAIFLLNTGRARRTEPLVNLFLEKCKDPAFDSACLDLLVPATHLSIDAFLAGDEKALYSSWKDISSFQLQHFTPMIPKLYLDLWKKGLNSDSFYLKLCGAGGGGFFLGMAKNFNRAKGLLSQYEIRPLLYL